MSARIQLTGSAASAAEFIVQNDVVRVGSDPTCDILIPEAPPRWFTLQRRGEEFLVHNRSQSDLRLGRKRIPPGSPAVVWSPDVPLALKSGITLELQVGNVVLPTDVCEQWVGPADNQETKMHDEAIDEAEGVSTRQLVILGICGVLVALMLLDVATTGPDGAQKSFVQIVSDLAARVQSGDPTAPLLLETLQEARYHEIRGEFEAAGRLYGFVRDDILTREDIVDGNWSSVDRHIYDYVRRRLQGIEGRSNGSVF